MKIVYTKHALEKFTILKELGWDFKKKDIADAIHSPDKTSITKDGSAIEILKASTEKISLKVVYAKFGDIIWVITFHPVERKRYEKKSQG